VAHAAVANFSLTPPIKKNGARDVASAKKQKFRFSSRFTKHFLCLVLVNAAFQLAPYETLATAIFLGGELIDRLQNIAGYVADRQYLNSRPLRHCSNGSGALSSSCPEIKLSLPFPAISAAAIVIVLIMFNYLVHLSSPSPSAASAGFDCLNLLIWSISHLLLRERPVEVPKKVLEIRNTDFSMCSTPESHSDG
jgi:hypothetical protein